MKRIDFCLLALVVLSYQPSQAMKETEKKLKKKFGNNYTMLQITSDHSSANDGELINSNSFDQIKLPNHQNQSTVFLKDFDSKKKSLVEKKIESHINQFYANMQCCYDRHDAEQALCKKNNVPFHGVAYPLHPQSDLKNDIKHTLNLGDTFENVLRVRLMELEYFDVPNYSNSDLFRVYIYSQLIHNDTENMRKEMVSLFAGMVDNPMISKGLSDLELLNRD